MAVKAARKRARKPVESAVKAEAEAVSAPAAEGESTIVRKKQLFDYVTENTSLKKREAREAVEATLQYLNIALHEENLVNIPPLGKIISKRVKVGTPGEKVVYKLNLRKVESEESVQAKEALAEVAD